MIHNDTGGVRILFELTLANMVVLWDGAALAAITVHEMTDDEVLETIGPREDPDASACAAMVFDRALRSSGAIDLTTITAKRFDEKETESASILSTSRKQYEATGA